MAGKDRAIPWLRAIARIGPLTTIFASRLFNLEHYRRATGIEFPSRLHAVAHFVTIGHAHDPHPLFSTQHYRSKAGLGSANTSALADYIRRGARQLLQPHPLFDPAWYVARHPQLDEAAKKEPLQHYLQSGWREGLKPHPLFDTQWYLQTYSDVAADHETNPLAHFVLYGGLPAERRQPGPFFDTDWYFRRYPDVEAAGHNALIHYVVDGAEEGRDPSPIFQTQWYRDAYPDVQALGYNPLAHYVEHGQAEGRPGAPPATPNRLDGNYSLAIDAFMSWRQTRLNEGRRPMLQRRGTEQTLHVVITPADSDEKPDSNTRAIFEEAAQACRMSLTILTHDRLDEFRADDIDDIVLFVREGDTIDRDGLAALRDAFQPSAQTCIFDAYYTSGARAYSVLQPGVNRPYLRAADVTFSRFALRGSLLETVLRKQKRNDVREILQAAIDTIPPTENRGGIVHCALPILQMPDLSDEIRAIRTSLISRTSSPDTRPTTKKNVSVVICTKDKGHLVTQLVRALLSQPQVADIAIVSNQTSNGFARRTLDRCDATPTVTVIDYDRPFNFSAQCNAGAAATHGKYILFLNDDIVPVSDDWLASLLAPFAEPAVGATAPLLLYPNETVQHAGMFMGYRGAAGHTLRHAVLPEGDYLFMGTAPREVACATGAALLLRRAVYEDLNGFDTQLDTIFQDIDLCLRIGRLGYQILYIPCSILLHMESVSILPTLDRPGVAEQRGRQHQYLLSRYGEHGLTRDPFANPGHDRQDETLRTLSA